MAVIKVQEDNLDCSYSPFFEENFCHWPSHTSAQSSQTPSVFLCTPMKWDLGRNTCDNNGLSGRWIWIWYVFSLKPFHETLCQYHCGVAVPHIQSPLSSSRESPLRISDHLSLPNDNDDHSRVGRDKQGRGGKMGETEKPPIWHQQVVLWWLFWGRRDREQIMGVWTSLEAHLETWDFYWMFCFPSSIDKENQDVLISAHLRPMLRWNSPKSPLPTHFNWALEIITSISSTS